MTAVNQKTLFASPFEDVVPDDSFYESDSEETEVESEFEEDNGYETYTSKDGKRLWKSMPPSQAGRRASHDVVKQIGGAAPHVKPQCVREAIYQLFLDG